MLKNGNQFLDSLKRLAEKFPNLKSIQIECVFVEDFSDLGQQLSPLKAISRVEEIGFVAKISKTSKYE